MLLKICSKVFKYTQTQNKLPILGPVKHAGLQSPWRSLKIYLNINFVKYIKSLKPLILLYLYARYV